MNSHDLGLGATDGVEELAEYLGVPVQRIDDWRLARTSPRAFKFGKRLKFAVSDAKRLPRSWVASARRANCSGRNYVPLSVLRRDPDRVADPFWHIADLRLYPRNAI